MVMVKGEDLSAFFFFFFLCVCARGRARGAGKGVLGGEGEEFVFPFFSSLFRDKGRRSSSFISFSFPFFFVCGGARLKEKVVCPFLFIYFSFCLRERRGKSHINYLVKEGGRFHKLSGSEHKRMWSGKSCGTPLPPPFFSLSLSLSIFFLPFSPLLSFLALQSFFLIFSIPLALPSSFQFPFSFSPSFSSFTCALFFFSFSILLHSVIIYILSPPPYPHCCCIWCSAAPRRLRAAAVAAHPAADAVAASATALPTPLLLSLLSPHRVRCVVAAVVAAVP